MLKNISNLDGSKELTKNEKLSIKGGKKGPCGATGGSIVNKSQAECVGYGFIWHNNRCWVCH